MADASGKWPGLHMMLVQFKVAGRVEVLTNDPEATARDKALSLKQADRARRDVRDFGVSGDYEVDTVWHSDECSCKRGAGQ